jgi:hypothetical protein
MATLFSSVDGDATGRALDRMDWVIDHQGPLRASNGAAGPRFAGLPAATGPRQGYPSLPSDREDLWVP